MFEANAAPRPKICTKELEQKGRRGFFARKKATGARARHV
jgi:hypothetical protein